MASMARGSAASLEEPAQRHTEEQRGGQEHDQSECNQGDVQGKQQLAEVQEDADAHLSDREGHRRTNADGGEVHDDIGELEHDLGEAREEAEHGRALLFVQAGQRDAEEDGEDGDLQDLAFCNRLCDVLREDVNEEVGPVRYRRGSGRESNAT